MPIIDTSILTGASDASVTKARVDDAINSQLVGMLATRRNCFNLIWGDGTDLAKSQAVIDEYTVNAGTLFALSQINDQAITAAATAAGVTIELSAPPFNVTINNDGSATLSAKE